ncbi:hypothetical protein SAFG77S_03950 [Streptomyces afghaniensis]
MRDQDALLVQDAQVDALAAGAGQVVGPHQSARPQLVHIEVGGAQAQQLRAELVAPGGVVLLHEALLLEGAQDAVGGALGQAQRRGDVRQAEPPLAARSSRGIAAARSSDWMFRAIAVLPPSPSTADQRRPQPLFGNAEHYRSMPTSR